MLAVLGLGMLRAAVPRQQGKAVEADGTLGAADPVMASSMALSVSKTVTVVAGPDTCVSASRHMAAGNVVDAEFAGIE